MFVAVVGFRASTFPSTSAGEEELRLLSNHLLGCCRALEGAAQPVEVEGDVRVRSSRSGKCKICLLYVVSFMRDFNYLFCLFVSKQVVWSPWARFGAIDDLEESHRLSHFRIIFRGPRCPTWYLGERVLMQTSSFFRVPKAPSSSMLRTLGIPTRHRDGMRQDVPADCLVMVDANYHEFLRDHILLPPVVHVCVIFGFVDMNIFVSSLFDLFLSYAAEPTTHDGWVLPDYSISYIAEGGSVMTEVVPEGFHPLIPEGSHPVRILC